MNQSYVAIHHFRRLSFAQYLTLRHQDRAVTQSLHQAKIVGDEENRDLAFLQLFQLLQAPIREDRVPHCQRFIHNQNVGFHVNGRRKCQPHIHTGRIFLDRTVDKISDIGELPDRRIYPLGVLARKTHDFAVQKHILAP